MARVILRLKILFAGRVDLNFDTRDDRNLISFLRYKKFDVNQTYQLMMGFYQFKVDNLEFNDLSMPLIRKVLVGEILQFLPLYSNDDKRVFVIKFINWDTSKISYQDILQGGTLAVLFMGLEPLFQINGFHFILDHTGFTYSQLFAFSVSATMKYINFVEVLAPFHESQFYIVNNSFLFNIVWNLLAPFLSSGLKNRVHVIGSDYGILVDKIGEENLEQINGGKLQDGIPFGRKFYEALESHYAEFAKFHSYGFVKKLI